MRRIIKEHGTDAGINEEDMVTMTPTHFELATAYMKLTDSSVSAAKRCLVDGELQKDVAADLGMKASQLSATVRSIQDKLSQIFENNNLELIEVALPKKLVNGVLQQEEFFIGPMLEARLARQAKLSKKPSKKAGR
jgi:hypothetical protein